MSEECTYISCYENQLSSLVYDWEVTVRDVCAPGTYASYYENQLSSLVYDWQVTFRNVFVYKFSYGLHKEQLKAGARGNGSVTLPSWNEFVVATEAPWCMLQPMTTTSSVIGVIAAIVEKGQHSCYIIYNIDSFAHILQTNTELYNYID